MGCAVNEGGQLYEIVFIDNFVLQEMPLAKLMFIISVYILASLHHRRREFHQLVNL